VDQNIGLYEPGTRGGPADVKGVEAVEKKFGVLPNQIVDLLALMGDSADNVPGVRKVGPKTAADLLKEYGNLEGIYENLESITKKALKANLIADKDNAFLSQKLVLLHTDLQLNTSLQDLKRKPYTLGHLQAFLIEYELHSLLQYAKKLAEEESSLNLASEKQDEAHPSTLSSEAHYQLVSSEEELSALCSKLEKAPILSIDTETTSLDTQQAELVGLCISWKKGDACYIPIAHQDTEDPNKPSSRNVSTALLQKYLGPVLRDMKKQFIFHNAKYDLPILERYDLAPSLSGPNQLIDTMVAAYLCNPGSRGNSLDKLAQEHFSHNMISIETLIGKKGKFQKSFSEVPVEEVFPYGAEDADVTFRLWDIYKEKLKRTELLNLFFDVEMPLLPVLQSMEAVGICLDTQGLRTLSQKMATELNSLKGKILEEAGEEFNINSPSQLGTILFEKLKLKTGKKTATGYSTDASVLQGLSGEHPIIDHILNYRELNKLKNTYVDVLPDLISPKTGRIHTSYSQTIAATGRLSSVHPNLQNIPIRTDHGKEIRKAFIAQGLEETKAGSYVLLAADYSQIELRVLAHLSGDPGLQEAYKKGLDIHAYTASALFHVPEEEVTSDMRRQAKVVNFGILYGMGPRRLAKDLGVSQSEGKAFIENYFSRYSKVTTFIEDTVEKARKQGYTETITGRRRYFPDIASSNVAVQKNAERMAVNTPIQGSAADLIKMAMIQLQKALLEQKLEAKILLQVHDELVLEVSQKDLEATKKLVVKIMENTTTLNVPLQVDTGVGYNWLEAH
jgi:DNA polymerase-1